jgi:hypothetical protein
MHDTTLHSLTSNNIPCLTRQQVDDMQLKEPILTPLFLSFFLSLSLSLTLSFLRLSSETTHAPPRAYTTSQQQHLPTTLQNKKQREQGTT